MPFHCQCCGNCCRWPGVVTPTDDEITQAAQLLGLDIHTFTERYTELSQDRSHLVYREQPDGACIFLQPDSRCRIYDARPRHCRTFPHEWDVTPDLQQRCAGRRRQLEEAAAPIRLVHVLGHPALPLDVAAAPGDAQVLNCRNLCLLLDALRIPYLYYGCPGSRLTSDLATLADCGKPTGRWSYRNAWHRLYNRRLTKRLARHARLDGQPELILSLYGAAQSDIDPLGLPVIEPMVGYDHCWAPYRVFPSYAHQHTLYATQRDFTRITRHFDTVIPHFMPLSDFLLDDGAPPPYKGEDFLLFIGRDAPDKGLSLARHAAEAAGLPLRVVHNGLFGQAKACLLARARAVLMPTLYVEPFGYVAIEAQLSGTPVITTDWGAFAETVIQGVTGFRCRTHAEFVRAILETPRLDRATIRESARRRFALESVAGAYESYFRFVWNVHHNGGYDAYGALRDLPPSTTDTTTPSSGETTP